MGLDLNQRPSGHERDGHLLLIWSASITPQPRVAGPTRRVTKSAAKVSHRREVKKAATRRRKRWPKHTEAWKHHWPVRLLSAQINAAHPWAAFI